MANLYTLIAELTCGDDDRAEKAALSIVAYHEGAIPVLSSLLDSPVEDTRWWVTRSLGAIRHRSATPLLLRALRDDTTSVRYCAAIALRLQADPTAIPALIMLLGSKDSMLARLASDALVEIGKPAVPALIVVLENGTPSECLGAVRALSKIRDYRAIPSLYKALDHDSAIVQFLAGKGLEDLGINMQFFNPNG